MGEMAPDCCLVNSRGFGKSPEKLAEEAGFEPAVGITPRTLSRRVT